MQEPPAAASTLPHPATDPTAGRINQLILWCFFFSGFSGLVYEVVWTRVLILVFGSTTFAISAVLTAFMGGLALGSWVAGRVVDRSRRPVLWYGILEFGIGLYALAVPAIFAGMTPLYQYIWRTWHPETYAAAFIRFVLAFVILLVPTTLMGATLPVLSKFHARREDAIGLSVGRLYAVNTFGAVTGTFAAGFLLLPSIGVSHTILFAAAINIALAGVALWASRLIRTVFPGVALTDNRVRAQLPGEPLTRPALIALICIAASGFIAMVYEVGWSRVLSLVLGSSVYAFTIMLTTFLAGLALGGYIFAVRADQRKQKGLLMLAALQVLVGMTAFATMHLFHELPYWFAFLFKKLNPGELGLLGIRFFLSATVMLLPTLFLGGMFPVVVALCSDDLRRVGRSVGTVYSVNTFGAILGSFAAGFLLIPTLGIQPTLVVAVTANLLLAGIVIMFVPRWSIPFRALTCALAILAAFNAHQHRPVWNPMLMSSGMYHYAPGLQRVNRASFKQFTQGYYDLLYYKEGITTTVTVAKQKGGANIWLATNGKIDASSELDMPTQVLSAHIPLLLHPHPKSVLVIGLASGVTVGSVQQHPVHKVTCVEIEPAIHKVAAKFFAHVNNHAVMDPRLDLVFNDGRNYLLVADAKHDIIISEPSNPWISGPSNLFTRECFELGKHALNPGGFYVQWVQLYGMTPPHVKSLIRTFHTVFPEVLVFQTIEQADLILVGAETRIRIDVQRIARQMRNPKIAADLARVGVRNIGDLLAHFRLGTDELSAYTGSAQLNTDDNLLIEFAAPKSLYMNTRLENEQEIARCQKSIFPYLNDLGERREQRARVLTEIAKSFLQSQRRTEAADILQKAAQLARGGTE